MTTGPKPAPPAQSLGPCQCVVNVETNEECGCPGSFKVRVDGRAVPAMIVLCHKHKHELNITHAALRTARKTA